MISYQSELEKINMKNQPDARENPPASMKQLGEISHLHLMHQKCACKGPYGPFTRELECIQPVLENTWLRLSYTYTYTVSFSQKFPCMQMAVLKMAQVSIAHSNKLYHRIRF